MVEVGARSEHCSSSGVRSKIFSAGNGSGDFPGFPYNAFLFSSCLPGTIFFFFCGEIMTQRKITQRRDSSIAQRMLQPTGYKVTTLPRPAAAGNTMRVTYLRCTVSSCSGKHLRSITHRIYSYQVYLGCCCRSSASFGTTPRYM